MLRQAAALQQPDLPMHAESLELAVTANANATASRHRFGDVLRVLPHRVLFFHREACRSGRTACAQATPANLAVEIHRMREVFELRIVEEILRLVEPIFAERSAVLDDQRR